MSMRLMILLLAVMATPELVLEASAVPVPEFVWVENPDYNQKVYCRNIICYPGQEAVPCKPWDKYSSTCRDCKNGTYQTSTNDLLNNCSPKTICSDQPESAYHCTEYESWGSTTEDAKCRCLEGCYKDNNAYACLRAPDVPTTKKVCPLGRIADGKGDCSDCQDGWFSKAGLSDVPCQEHTNCTSLGKCVIQRGNSTADNECSVKTVSDPSSCGQTPDEIPAVPNAKDDGISGGGWAGIAIAVTLVFVLGVLGVCYRMQKFGKGCCKLSRAKNLSSLHNDSKEDMVDGDYDFQAKVLEEVFQLLEKEMPECWDDLIRHLWPNDNKGETIRAMVYNDRGEKSSTLQQKMDCVLSLWKQQNAEQATVKVLEKAVKKLSSNKVKSVVKRIHDVVKKVRSLRDGNNQTAPLLGSRCGQGEGLGLENLDNDRSQSERDPEPKVIVEVAEVHHSNRSSNQCGGSVGVKHLQRSSSEHSMNRSASQPYSSSLRHSVSEPSNEREIKLCELKSYQFESAQTSGIDLYSSRSSLKDSSSNDTGLVASHDSLGTRSVDS